MSSMHLKQHRVYSLSQSLTRKAGISRLIPRRINSLFIPKMASALQRRTNQRGIKFGWSVKFMQGGMFRRGQMQLSSLLLGMQHSGTVDSDTLVRIDSGQRPRPIQISATSMNTTYMAHAKPAVKQNHTDSRFQRFLEKSQMKFLQLSIWICGSHPSMHLHGMAISTVSASLTPIQG